jgi:hypothetical protein
MWCCQDLPMFLHLQLRNMSSRGRNVDQFGLSDDDQDDLSKASTAATSSACSPSDASLGLCEDNSSDGGPLSSAQQDLKDKEEQVLAKVLMLLKACIFFSKWTWNQEAWFLQEKEAHRKHVLFLRAGEPRPAEEGKG